MTLPVRFAAFLLFSLIAATTLAQYQPQVGQAGKDVIWVPTPDEVVDRMFLRTKRSLARRLWISCDQFVINL